MARTPLVIRGDGLRLFCTDGSEYLDAISGTFNLPLGYSYPPVVDAVRKQLERMCHLNSALVRPYSDELLERLLTFAPAGVKAGWMRDATGSTAVECAVKIAQRATGKPGVIALDKAHHGQTYFTTALSGAAWRRNRFPTSGSLGVIHVPSPLCKHCLYGLTYPDCKLACASRIPDYVQQEDRWSASCLIVEPVLGNGGNIVPPKGYFKAIRQVCDELGVLLIADEVQTGVGRTGYFLASEYFELQPDIIVLAKGLGGIGLPIGAVLMREELDILEPTDHSFTAGANLLSLAAARATVDIVGEESFLASVRERGAYLGRLLLSLQQEHPTVGQVTGLGMMWGVEIVDQDGRADPRAASAVVAVALDCHHLITRCSEYGRGHVVKLRPALVATRQELEEIVRRLSSSIRDATGAVDASSCV